MGGLCFQAKKNEDAAPKPEPKKSRITQQDRAKLDIRKRQQQLREYQKKLEGEQAGALAKAKELARAGQKQRAVVQLRLKKAYDANIEKAQNMHFMLENTYMQIESVEVDAQVVTALKKGDEAIQQLKVDISEFERIKDNMDDYADQQEQLTDLLKDDGFDEQQMLDDLRALDDDAEAPALPDAPQAPVAAVLPSAPSGEVAQPAGPAPVKEAVAA